MRGAARAGIVIVCGLAAGCTVGPDYRRPAAAVPALYKEASWAPARPADMVDRGPWWSIYGDPLLDGLERRVDVSNQNLKAAEAAFREAEAIVAQARAGFFPTISLDATAERLRGGGFGSRGGAATAAAASATGGAVVATSAGSSGTIRNFFSILASVNWIPDLWGKVRRTVEGDVATAQASAGDVASARLAAQDALASDYLQLRSADELKRLLDRSVAAFAEALRITRNQYAAGTAAASDVAQAETQLKSTEAQAIAVGVTRSQLEHAIAVLIGTPPAELTIAPVTAELAVPEIPAGLPSQLLERRPDIAAAERRVAAANAQIGVADAAFYPVVTLFGDAGTQHSRLAKLFTASSKVWSFGSDLVETVFDAGARQAQVEQAKDVWDQAIANYRQTVLTAFQQVEDELAAQRILAQEAVAQAAAVAAARQAEQIIFNQYKAGTVPYTSVVVAQNAALTAAETEVNLRQSRLTASAALIQALGGGWNAAQLPSESRIEADSPLNFNPFPPPDPPPR
jgi:NodT family efflux transporter outer membrane factor (OMF) lipoprotein